ncbi:MAG: hypothetical protein HFI63_12005 [Lachnospiraceae bacterium]|nr:hypothetical protein [Lachnospiraceae bacterium]
MENDLIIFYLGSKKWSGGTKDVKTWGKYKKKKRWSLGRPILPKGTTNRKKYSAFCVCKDLWRSKRKIVGSEAVHGKNFKKV